jgi:hypothetical protein
MTTHGFNVKNPSKSKRKITVVDQQILYYLGESTDRMRLTICIIHLRCLTRSIYNGGNLETD